MIARKARATARDGGSDVGKFGGSPKQLDESIKYRIAHTLRGRTGRSFWPEPTCDSADILYERTRYELPLSLASGDRVEILSAGAYTEQLRIGGFNGFPSAQDYCL